MPRPVVVEKTVVKDARSVHVTPSGDVAHLEVDPPMAQNIPSDGAHTTAVPSVVLAVAVAPFKAAWVVQSTPGKTPASLSAAALNLSASISCSPPVRRTTHYPRSKVVWL